MAVANTLAYCNTATIMAVKNSIVQQAQWRRNKVLWHWHLTVV